MADKTKAQLEAELADANAKIAAVIENVLALDGRHERKVDFLDRCGIEAPEPEEPKKAVLTVAFRVAPEMEDLQDFIEVVQGALDNSDAVVGFSTYVTGLHFTDEDPHALAIEGDDVPDHVIEALGLTRP